MCELFGLCANKEVSVSFTWRGFVSRGRIHRDGWGVAWYVGKGVALVKEPRPASSSPMATFLLNRIRSHMVISHVRWATQGNVSYVNTHPFVRELYGYEWVFAHNGDVSEIMDDPEFRLRYYHPIGDTDSEYAFCYMLDNLRDVFSNPRKSMLSILAEPIELFKEIWRLATKIGQYGKFNFLMSNGRYLFAYCNRSSTLFYVTRYPPHEETVKLLDEDFEVSLKELKGFDEVASIVATKPLTDEQWRSIDVGSLYVFGDGVPILRIDRYGNAELCLDRNEKELLELIATRTRISIRELVEELDIDRDEVLEALRRLRLARVVKLSRPELSNETEVRIEPSKNWVKALLR